ncbi:putative CdaR family transcriptional regulator [Gordonia araii NBRC 100433]|uniref:Putative CdaR family transcriptional regulator n=1 Tax=Gordonia araii NBRC 100433 TaxID=1073574 RepID=G7H5W2_9ACTN|nr:PucR family transcriptional regulator [Gordonia araii]NNG95687.1 helix-turn-helix domain-containing protein [Gordonia araii NBRC 100433]GAB11237.1 putative CdaR family transcriptional regulator [Gordonia araii NBRC 100433]
MTELSVPDTAARSDPQGEASLVHRLRARWPDIAERMLADGLASSAPAGLPDTHFTDDVLPAIHLCGHAVLEAIAADRELTYDEVHAFAGPVAEQHAEDRLPLPVLLLGIHGSAQALLAAAADTARPDETPELVAVGERLLNVLTNINLSVVATYAEVEQSIYRSEREARRELCAALVHGRPVAAVAARADIAIAASYLVVTVRLFAEHADAAAATLIARRRMRVLQRSFDELSATTTPLLFDGVNGVVLMADPPVGDERVHERLDALAVELTNRFDVPVYLGEIGAAPPEGIPAAVADAAELIGLARALDRAPGSYRLDDLLVEFQVSRPSAARDRLAQQVAPLHGQPHLLDALYAHLKHGANRKAAAAQVHVHPNTLSYRLKRVHELTGYDPTDPYQSRVLAAALIVARVPDFRAPVPDVAAL